MQRLDSKQMSVKRTTKALDAGQLDLMFNFLRMGHQRPNIPALKEHLEAIRQAMIQKTGGNRPEDPPYYTDHDDIGTHINCVVVEAMCLYLSGRLDVEFENGGQKQS